MSIKERIDNITQISTAYSSVTPPIPESVKIELTARCNHKCKYCATRMNLRDKAEMDIEFYKRIVMEMREAGVQELGVFYLGESFLCPWLAEAIRYAKEDCGYPYVFLTANGTACNEEKLRAVMEAGLDSLKWSFNYADEEQFEDITQIPGKNFNKFIENIAAAYWIREEGGYPCKLYASSIKYADQQFDKMKAAVERILPFVDEHYWLPLYGQAGLVTKDLDGKPMPGNPGRLGALRKPLPCWAAFTEGHITYDGILAACCFSHEERFHMADLNEVSFVDGWNSLKFQELREANLKCDVSGTACEDCVIL